MVKLSSCPWVVFLCEHHIACCSHAMNGSGSRARRELVGMTKSSSSLANSGRDRGRRPRAGELASSWQCTEEQLTVPAQPHSSAPWLGAWLGTGPRIRPQEGVNGGPPLRADLFRRTPPSVEINPQPSLRWTLFPFKSSCPSPSPATTAKHAFDSPRYLRHPQPTELPTEHSLTTSTYKPTWSVSSPASSFLGVRNPAAERAEGLAALVDDDFDS